MNPALRKALAGAAIGGALSIAAVLGHWYEGDGPTRVIDGVKYHVSYVDPVGVWTVCRGLTGAVAGPGKAYTTQQCVAMEHKVRLRDEAAVRRLIPAYDGWNDWRKAAILDWTWNFGETKLGASTMRAKFNAGDVVGGCRELSRWVYGNVGGVMTKLKGLVLRRADEQTLCLEGLK